MPGKLVSMLVPSHWKGCRGRSPPTLSTEGRDRGNWLEANEVFRVIRDMQSRKWPEALRNQVFKEQAKSEALGLRLPTALCLSWAYQALPVSIRLARLSLLPLAFTYCYKAEWADGLRASWAGRILPCSMMSAAAKGTMHGGAALWNASL